MKTGIYIHGINLAAGFIFEDLKGRGLKVDDPKGCLCQSQKKDSLQEIVICHPDPDNGEECLDEVRNLISNNPETQFYILAHNRQKKVEGVVGEYPNLKYVSDGNIRKVGQEIFDSAGK